MMQSGSVITLAEPRPTHVSRPLRLTQPTNAAPTTPIDDAAPVDGVAAPVDAVSPTFDLATEYDAHGSALFGFAVNTLRDRGLAEDCVQETFLRAWRARDRYDGARATTRTWLFAIARNVIIDVQRSLQRMPRIAPDEDAGEKVAAASDPLDRLGMTEALAKLSDEHRNVVVAVHLHGQSYAELSEASGVPVSTLRTRAFYGLRALRSHLDPQEITHD